MNLPIDCKTWNINFSNGNKPENTKLWIMHKKLFYEDEEDLWEFYGSIRLERNIPYSIYGTYSASTSEMIFTVTNYNPYRYIVFRGFKLTFPSNRYPHYILYGTYTDYAMIPCGNNARVRPFWEEGKWVAYCLEDMTTTSKEELIQKEDNEDENKGVSTEKQDKKAKNEDMTTKKEETLNTVQNIKKLLEQNDYKVLEKILYSRK
ncbi:hypothetical protein [Clostridium ganghwense]|uniref:Uncharacterized protein n=1 Tax=Clostridium ganghwense TaxID=312089 RepID=A0ABT4CQF2_9CLOT|nr:hypothetical protein [Clostridium ganghwense]MCY6371148.1 hypothetical protein [Clostridium ganghwense]